MIEVSGYLENSLSKPEDKEYLANITDVDEFVSSFVNAPIIMDGKPIGVINEVDLESKMWYGVIWYDGVISVDLCRENYATSVEFRKT